MKNDNNALPLAAGSSISLFGQNSVNPFYSYHSTSNSMQELVTYKIMTNMLNKSIEKGEPDLNITFIYNMPFRGIAKMAGGMCTMEMAEGILTVCNGHFFKGMGTIIGGFFRSGKRRKAANAIH